MSTPDIIITAVAIMFILCVIPAIRSAQKPPVATSAPLLIGLTTIAIVYASLGLMLGAITTFAQAVLWGVVMVQRMRQPVVHP
jgi:hypothetical protein